MNHHPGLTAALGDLVFCHPTRSPPKLALGEVPQVRPKAGWPQYYRNAHHVAPKHFEVAQVFQSIEVLMTKGTAQPFGGLYPFTGSYSSNPGLLSEQNPGGSADCEMSNN